MMGHFANSPMEPHRLDSENPPTPMWLGPKTSNEPWHGQSGYEAMGHVVPAFRKAACYRDLKMQGWGERSGGVGGNEWCFHMVEMFADRIARDDSHGAMEEAFNRGMNATSVYRTLAVILAAERPALSQENV